MMMVRKLNMLCY